MSWKSKDYDYDYDDDKSTLEDHEKDDWEIARENEAICDAEAYYHEIGYYDD